MVNPATVGHARRPATDLVEALVGLIRLRSGLPLVLMPITAIGVYAPVPIWTLTLPTNWVLDVVTMPLGFLLLIHSLWVLHCVRG